MVAGGTRPAPRGARGVIAPKVLPVDDAKKKDLPDSKRQAVGRKKAAVGLGGSSQWQQINAGAGASKQGGGGDAAGARARFTVEDSAGTRKAIQNEWKQGKKTKDVLSACARIDAFLDNPLFASDKQRAAVTVQRVVRGWALRLARTRGTLLFPVEAQALADGRVLMLNEYGARIYSLGPLERRRLVGEHFAAKKLQRVWRRHRPTNVAVLRPEDSCISLAPEDSLLNVAADVKFIDFACSEQQALSAVQVLQQAMRGRLARKQCQRMRMRMSKAVKFLRFLSTELSAAMATDADRIRDAAALRMQASWRGACCRYRSKDSRGTRASAAVTLQKTVRGWASRRQMGKLLEKLLLRRVLRCWNKIMWTVYSPSKTCDALADDSQSRFFGEDCANAGDDEQSSRKQEADAEAGAENKTTPRQEAECISPPNVTRPSKSGGRRCGGLAACDAEEDEDGGRQRSLWVEREEDGDDVLVAHDTPRERIRETCLETTQETPRQSWQVVEGTDAKCDTVQPVQVVIEDVRERECGVGDQAAGSAPKKTEWPEMYSSSMCFEPGALKQGTHPSL